MGFVRTVFDRKETNARPANFIFGQTVFHKL